MTTLSALAPLLMTGHPLQRCGARAVVALAERESPAEVTPDDLNTVAATMVDDMVRAAAAAKDTLAYDWWKVLFALYPNSPATHSKRSHDPGQLHDSIAALFASDPPDGAKWPCTFCGQPAGMVWGKDRLPMFDSPKAVNTLPPRLAGWPVCWACRIAVWALPYGAWVTAGFATVMMCANDAVEHRFVQGNRMRAARIQQLGFAGLSANASAETVTLEALREHAGGAPVSTTLWIFKNDNQDAKLRVTATRGGVPAFIRAMFADPDCRAGWQALQSALTERDRDGRLKTSGMAAGARTLFDPADRPGELAGDRLQRELLRLARNTERFTGRSLMAWRALCRLYLEVMYGMDVGQVKPARELIVDWIMQEQNRRGRFNEYARAAGRAFELQRLLMMASARLYLDGRQPPDLTSVTPALLASDGNGWRLRGLLFFDVVADLVSKGVMVGQKTDTEEDDELTEMTLDPDLLSGQDSEEYA